MSVPSRFLGAPLCRASNARTCLLPWTLIGGTYALVIGMFVAALTGLRGLTGAEPLGNRLVYFSYLAGTVTTLTGCSLLPVGLIRFVVTP
jgi:hypothetical protein